MKQYLQFLNEHALAMNVFVAVWLAAVIGGSVVFRRFKGKPLLLVEPSDAVFAERWSSGRSLRTFFGRLGGARNCLFIAVTQRELIVRPHFPFTLLFLPEIYGLEDVVALSCIRGVQLVEGIGGESVLITVQRTGEPRYQLSLRPRAASLLVAALGGAR